MFWKSPQEPVITQLLVNETFNDTETLKKTKPLTVKYLYIYFYSRQKKNPIYWICFDAFLFNHIKHWISKLICKHKSDWIRTPAAVSSHTTGSIIVFKYDVHLFPSAAEWMVWMSLLSLKPGKPLHAHILTALPVMFYATWGIRLHKKESHGGHSADLSLASPHAARTKRIASWTEPSLSFTCYLSSTLKEENHFFFKEKKLAKTIFSLYSFSWGS